MSPPQVLHEQAALIDFVSADPYKGYLERFFAYMQRKGKIGKHPPAVQGMQVPWGEFISYQIAQGAKVAQAYHVNKDMMPLLKAAAYDLDSLDYLVHERLPAESGFMVFEDGWPMTDTWGQQFVINALHWKHGSASIDSFSDAKAVPGIWIYTFNDINDTRDERTQEEAKDLGWDALRQYGKYHLNHFFFLAYEARIGPVDVLTDEQYAAFADASHLKLAASASNPRRMIVAIFRMLSQVIVEVRDEPLNRQQKKMAVRKNIPARVQTVKLRRKEIVRPLGEEGISTVEWKHQWLVRGHWAWRACSEHHVLAEPYEKGWHARVYVAPYWKGPEDAPVHITEKVWDLAR